MIICATGYEMRFPFFDDAETDLHPDDDHRYPLFKRMIKPGVDHLFFLGLAQSSPTIVNLAEQQSKLLAKLLTGSYALPRVEEQERIMVADEQAHLEQYYAAPAAHHPDRLRAATALDLHEEIAAGEAAGAGRRAGRADQRRPSASVSRSRIAAQARCTIAANIRSPRSVRVP